MPDSHLHPESGFKGHRNRAQSLDSSSNHINDGGRVLRHRNTHIHKHPYSSSASPPSRIHTIRWLLIGAIVGSALTQLLSAIATPSHYVQHVGYYDEDGAFHPFRSKADTNQSQPAAASDAERYAQANLKPHQQEQNKPMPTKPLILVSHEKAVDKDQMPVSKTDTSSSIIALKQQAMIRNAKSNHSKRLDDFMKAVNVTAAMPMREGFPSKRKGIPDIAFEPIFVKLPPPPKLEPDDFVSACLLIKGKPSYSFDYCFPGALEHVRY